MLAVVTPKIHFVMRKSQEKIEVCMQSRVAFSRRAWSLVDNALPPASLVLVAFISLYCALITLTPGSRGLSVDTWPTLSLP